MSDQQYPLGWIPYEDRTQEENEAHDSIIKAMPVFSMPTTGETPPVGTKVLLTDTWIHPRVVKDLGMPFEGIRQVTGSCVWAGGQTAMCTLNFIEVLLRNDADRITIPFCLPNYGKSREYAGMRGQGSGSLGSTFAKSLSIDGTSDALSEGRPKFTTNDMLCYGQAIELKYSEGRAIPQSDLTEGRKHLIRTVTPISSFDAARDAIINLYPVTRASSYFVNPGTAVVKEGVLLGEAKSLGGHQESWLGYYHHPVLGELIWEQNQWGKLCYGQTKDPAGGPWGGCWRTRRNIETEMNRGGEYYALSQWDGYPAQSFSWIV